MSRLALLVATFLFGLPALAQADVFDAPVAPALAGTLPPGFTETTVWSGLGNPMAVRFAPDGRVFVASKSGLVNVFDSLTDTTPTVYADLRTRVHDFWDRGLLGLALDPGFTSGRPYVYVLYAYDKAPNSSLQPRWGDGCPSPPGATDDGCVITGRLSRLNAAGAETVLIEDFCQQYPSHSLGHDRLRPGRDALRVERGTVRRSTGPTTARTATPSIPAATRRRRAVRCGRRASAARRRRTRPSTARSCACTRTRATPRRTTRRSATRTRGADGSSPTACATRSASPSAPARARSGRATSAGTPTRRSTARPTSRRCATTAGPVTRARRAKRPTTASTSPAARRCTPRAPRPRRTSPTSTPRRSCRARAARAARRRSPAWRSTPRTSSRRRTSTRSSSATTRADCIWVMFRGANGLPDPATRATFLAGAEGPVFLTQGPDGALYYADLQGGRIRRVAADNSTPTARIAANPTSGLAPLTVAFSGTGSSDPESQPLSYAWDLDGDGAYDDSTAAAPSRTYTAAGRRDRAAAGQRSWRAAGDDLDHDHGRRTAGGDVGRAVGGGDVGRRRHGQLLRLRAQQRGRDASGVGAALVAEPAPLLARRRHRLPHARHPGLRGRRLGALRRP